MSSLYESIASLVEKPRFDVIVGLEMIPPLKGGIGGVAEWMNAVRETIGPSARWVLAFRREAENPPWSEWLAEAPAALREKVLSIPHVKQEASTGERLEQSLQAMSGWQVNRIQKGYEDRRRLSPAQAKEWMNRAASRNSHFGNVRSGLGVEGWEQLLTAISVYFTRDARNFPAEFDVLIAEPN